MTEIFWISCSFTVLVIALYKPVKAGILSLLDQNIDKVVRALREAEALRQEAVRGLQEVEVRLAELNEYSKSAIVRAEEEAAVIITEAKEAAKAETKRLVELTMQNFESKKASLLDQIKEQVVLKAINVVSEKYQEEGASDVEYALIDSALGRGGKKTKH